MKLKNIIALLAPEQVVTLEHYWQHHIIEDRKTVEQLLDLTLYQMDLKNWAVACMEVGDCYGDLIISITPV